MEFPAMIGAVRAAACLGALALLGCGKPSPGFDDLIGEWEYEACTWGREGMRQMPCAEFRPLGTLEVKPDSAVILWLAGRQAFQSGRILEIDFSGEGGVLTGKAQGDAREARVEFRFDEGRLVYSLEFQGQAEMRGVVESGILKKR